MYCQLVYICGLVPAHIRRALAELPETLDETYERTLRQICKADWEFARRLFQFVAVASRPLRVEELADLLAFDFKPGPIPKFNEGWRQEDPVDVVLSTCSSLLATVDDHHFSQEDRQRYSGKFIQFSHFSVKEYLMSTRLAEAADIIPRRYHISLTVAHTLVAQACLGILLHLDEDVVTSDSLKELPLAEYAAEYWADHARLEGVWRNVEDGIKQLFDPSKSHLAVCIWIHDPDPPGFFDPGPRIERPEPLHGTTLHYAALWGFHSIVESLVIKNPQDVRSHYSPGYDTPLHFASKKGHVEVARVLLEHGADVTARNCFNQTPLNLASARGQAAVVNLLIENGADESVREMDSPLLLAIRFRQVEVARLLIEHGADVTLKGEIGWTPLHLASDLGALELVNMFIEYGADVTAQTGDGYTPLDVASCKGYADVAGMLIDRGANVTSEEGRRTPLHLASLYGQVEVAHLLIARGADVKAHDEDGNTPLHLVSRRPILIRDLPWVWHDPSPQQYAEVARILLEHGADVTVRDKNGRTPFEVASSDEGFAEVAQVLLQHRADSDSNHVSLEDESIPIPSQRIRSPSETSHHSHSGNVPDTEVSGNDPTGFSDEEGEVEEDEEPRPKRRKVDGGYC